MRVFVTGATGFVGSAVVQDLIEAGHQVLGLARSEASAAALKAAGAEAHLGNLEDTDSLRRGAKASDAVIHTGFNHDFSRYKENCEADTRAIEALGSVLAGSDRRIIVTSGTGLLTPGQLATEDQRPNPDAPNPRRSEKATEDLEARGIAASVVRLPPSVHGDGDHGFVPILIDIARRKGVSVYIDEGQNLWPAVHRLDAGRLFRLALEKGVAGARYHGAAEEGVPFREIAAVIGKHLGVPVMSKSKEDAAAHFEWFAHFAQMDCPTSSVRTRRELGWHPTQAGLIADIDRPVYFEG